MHNIGTVRKRPTLDAEQLFTIVAVHHVIALPAAAARLI
jgi:hypothetical protein